MQQHLQQQNIDDVLEIVTKRRAGSELQVKKTTQTTNRMTELDKELEHKYHRKISEIKDFIKKLTPLYLTFADREEPLPVEKMNVFGSMDLRADEMHRKYSLGKLSQKSQQRFSQAKHPKHEYYNKWYIKPEQRFIEKKKSGDKLRSDEYLKKILDGDTVKKAELNPFEAPPPPSPTTTKQNRQIRVDPVIIKKAAKSIEKSDKRIPVFFLPYLKKV